MSMRTLAVGAAIGAVVATAVGVAYAAIPDGKGVIHGCYATAAPHSLQVIDTATTTTCPSGTTALNWNAKGPVGPSNAYAAFHDGDIALSTSGTNLLSFDLKAGSYVIQAKTVLITGGCGSTVSTICQVATFTSCKLQAGFDFDTTSAGADHVTFQGGEARPLAHVPTGLIVVHSATAPFRVTLSCTDGTYSSGGHMNSVAADIKLVAIKVGSLVNAGQ